MAEGIVEMAASAHWNGPGTNRKALQPACLTPISKTFSIFEGGHTMRKAVFGIIALGLSTGVSAQDNARLDLVCLGAGAATRNAAIYGDGGTATIIGNRDTPFDDQVNLSIENGEGRLRMPRAMLPALHGGEGGWFKLKNVHVTDTEITASVAVNPLNSPKLRLDRLTGAISLSGKSGDYSGRCAKYEPATTQRAF